MQAFQSYIHARGPRLALFASIQFFVLTLLAMLFYPGGTVNDPAATYYLFFHNFFSELGITQVYDGAPNPVSALLFFITLSLAGLGLVIFFVALPGYFSGRGQKWLCYLGTLFGIISGLSFIGVAFSPADLALTAHRNFVFGAFISFFLAVLPYSVAVFRQSDYPNRYAVIYLIFSGLLAAYIYLLFTGPTPATVDGRVIQVTGQKVIVYATLTVTLIQAHGLEKRDVPAEAPVQA